MIKNSVYEIQRIAWWGILFLIGLGILMRFYNITADEFYLYDEGFYLSYNHLLIKLWKLHPPETWEEWKQAILVWFRFSMASGKALWFLIVDSRIFVGGIDWLFFPRIVSAVAGCLTLWVTFLFANRFFNSIWVGILSTVFLALLPSHVFYSKLGFQEALSTLFFVSGFYFYFFSKSLPLTFFEFTGKISKLGGLQRWYMNNVGLTKGTFLSGLFFTGAYFTNYRLVVIPALVVFSEIVISFAEKRIPNFRKYVWTMLVFAFFVVVIGNLDMKENAMVTYSWMFHQADLAETRFDWINLFSYPYYLFRLESFLFGVLFFGNIYYIIRKEYGKLFPFAIVCFQMFIFSLTAEKAARYLCVVTPFMAMAVASLIIYILNRTNDQLVKMVSIAGCILALLSLLFKSFEIVTSHSDYKPAVEFLTSRNPTVKILSTQPWVQNLYVYDSKNVRECPHKFERLVQIYMNGFRYLTICPQSYISWTKDGKRFSPELEDYLGFTTSSVKPVKVFSHLTAVLLERFVFEHNENLWRSMVFLNSHRKHLGDIRIYDIKEILASISQRTGHRKNQ